MRDFSIRAPALPRRWRRHGGGGGGNATIDDGDDDDEGQRRTRSTADGCLVARKKKLRGHLREFSLA